MNNPLMAMIGMGGGNTGPSIAPQLAKQLKTFRLTPSNITDHLNQYREEAYVFAHPRLGQAEGAALTGDRLYPIHAIRFSDDGSAIEATIADNHDLRYSENVLLVGTRSEITEDLPTTSKLILVLGEMRDLLEEKWAGEMVKTTNHLMKRYVEYNDLKTFTAGDLVVFKEDMVVAGALQRRGTAVVMEKLLRYGSNIRRCPKTHEIQDLIIAVFDDDGDFALMPISSNRLLKVSIDQVGTYRNPFVMKKPPLDEEPVEVPEAVES